MSLNTFKVLVVGGSYSGLSYSLKLLDLSNGRSHDGAEEIKPRHRNISIELTIVDERDGYYHLLGSPLAFASPAYAAKSWVKYQDIPALQQPNIHTIQGSVTHVDTGSKTAHISSGTSGDPQVIAYDFLVAASGLRRSYPVVPHSTIRDEYLQEVSDHAGAMSNSQCGVLVVGGGAVGIEMAAELKLVYPHLKVTLAHSRDNLLSSEDLPDGFKTLALEILRGLGVDVLLNHRVAAVPKGPISEVEFTNGHRLATSQVIMAISRPDPSSSFLPSVVADEEGYISILPSLFIKPVEGIQNAEFHLAIGDVARWSGIKRFGRAKQMGELAAYNTHQRILSLSTESKPPKNLHVPVLKELPFIPNRMALAIGNRVVMYEPGTGAINVEDAMKTSFRDDLAFASCWDLLLLGKNHGTA